jgi:PAS domain-containing protein
MPASGSIDFWWPIVIATIIALTLVVAVIGMVLAQQRSKIISTREKLGIIETSERRYGTLFNNVTDIVYIHTPDGTILQANDAAFSLLRLRQDQVIGRKLSDFVVISGD